MSTFGLLHIFARGLGVLEVISSRVMTVLSFEASEEGIVYDGMSLVLGNTCSIVSLLAAKVDQEDYRRFSSKSLRFCCSLRIWVKGNRLSVRSRKSGCS